MKKKLLCMVLSLACMFTLPGCQSTTSGTENGTTGKTQENKQEEIIPAVSALGYDSYLVAIKAIENAGSTDTTAIRDALKDVSIDGVTGSISSTKMVTPTKTWPSSKPLKAANLNS